MGKNVKIFHGVEFSFGYNLTIEDNCAIHKYVLLDDRGEIIIHEGSSVSDYANVYSHSHDLNDGMLVSNHHRDRPEGAHHLSRDRAEWSENRRARHGGLDGGGTEKRGAVYHCRRHSGQAGEGEDHCAGGTAEVVEKR